jgi:hypothetical protein
VRITGAAVRSHLNDANGAAVVVCRREGEKPGELPVEVDTQPDEFTEIRVILPRVAALLS